jgi:hypothetical protein
MLLLLLLWGPLWLLLLVKVLLSQLQLLLQQFAVLLQALSCRPSLTLCIGVCLSTQRCVALCADPLQAPQGAACRGPGALGVHNLLLLLLLCVLLWLLLGHVDVHWCHVRAWLRCSV